MFGIIVILVINILEWPR